MEALKKDFLKEEVVAVEGEEAVSKPCFDLTQFLFQFSKIFQCYISKSK